MQERIFKDMQLKTSFISERLSKEEKLNWVFRELLLRYFERVELVTFDNNMRYEDSTEVFERLCNLYPENKKYLLDNEMLIREYFECIILEDGTVIYDSSGQNGSNSPAIKEQAGQIYEQYWQDLVHYLKEAQKQQIPGEQQNQAREKLLKELEQKLRGLLNETK